MLRMNSLDTSLQDINIHVCVLSFFSITFGISIGLCAMALIIERNEGLIDRTWVAGVNAAEIVIAQVVTQFFILAVQITLLLVVVIFAFKVNM